jgi:hypothetical protein
MVRDHLLLIAIVAITSASAVAIAWGQGVRALGRAVLLAVEIVGAATLFFAANVGVGVALVLAARRFSPYYPTLYEVSDVSLLLFSLVQALVLQIWLSVRVR